jgi:hypothetical protein
MNVKARIATTVLLLGLTTLALASSAVAAGPQGSYRDANERAGAAAALPAQVSAYSDANSRSQAVQATSPAGAAAYLDAAERAAADARVTPGQVVGHVDVFEGTKTPVGPADVTPVAISDGFDWGAAAIGASSMFMVALLVGAALIFTRRPHGGLIAR